MNIDPKHDDDWKASYHMDERLVGVLMTWAIICGVFLAAGCLFWVLGKVFLHE